MNQIEVAKYPQSDARDKIYSLVINLVSPIPYASPLIAAIVKSPIEKRLQLFHELLAEQITYLLQTVADLTPESLSQNDGFITTLVEACEQAEKIHQNEKRQSVCNAVLNSALPNPPDETKQRIFMRWLDEMTIWHIRILRLFDGIQFNEIYLNLDDNEWRMNIAVSELARKIEAIYPELIGQSALYLQIISDLHSKVLIANILPDPNMISRLPHFPEHTVMAKEFLKTISSPILK